jgi:hypothetical protein
MEEIYVFSTSATAIRNPAQAKMRQLCLSASRELYLLSETQKPAFRAGFAIGSPVTSS